MFYENVQNLCKEHKTNITRMSKDIGLSNAAAASWRKGSTPKGDTLQKIADYFGVSIDSLLGEANPCTISNTRDSVILQGNRGNCTVANGQSQAGYDRLTEQEAEVLRIFRGLDMRKKTAVLSYLYGIEDGVEK